MCVCVCVCMIYVCTKACVFMCDCGMFVDMLYKLRYSNWDEILKNNGVGLVIK